MKMDPAKQGAILARLAGLNVVQGSVIVPMQFGVLGVPVAKAINNPAVVNRAIASLTAGQHNRWFGVLRDIGGWDHFPNPSVSQLLGSNNALKAEAVLRVCGLWEEGKKPERPVPDLSHPLGFKDCQLCCGVDGYVRVKDGRTVSEYINDPRLVEQRKKRIKGVTPLVCISHESLERLRASERQLATLCGAIAGALEDTP